MMGKGELQTLDFLRDLSNSMWRNYHRIEMTQNGRHSIRENVLDFFGMSSEESFVLYTERVARFQGIKDNS